MSFTLKGKTNTDFARVGNPGGTSNPELLDRETAPLCDEFGRLIIVVDGLINFETEAGAAMAILFGNSLNGGFNRQGAEGFQNVVQIASAADVEAITKFWGFNNSSSPAFIQIWFTETLDYINSPKALALTNPVSAYGNFNIDGIIPFQVFGGTSWNFMIGILSSDALMPIPVVTPSLWANWNYTTKTP